MASAMALAPIAIAAARKNMAIAVTFHLLSEVLNFYEIYVLFILTIFPGTFLHWAREVIACIKAKAAHFTAICIAIFHCHDFAILDNADVADWDFLTFYHS